MKLLKNWVRAASSRARRKRAVIFRSSFDLKAGLKILDLGSEDGSHIAAVLKDTPVINSDVYIADIDGGKLARGSREHGFNTILIDESGRLPFPDGFFDIVYCSSVIEHVTIQKSEVWSMLSGSNFKRRAAARQREFADEIRRVARQYFVQTPNVHFLVESHSWLPLAGFLPRRALLPLLKLTNRFWIKQTSPDWCLLNRRELQAFFPEARLANERVFGLTKSLMAILSAKAR